MSYVHYDIKGKLNSEGDRITDDTKPATLVRTIQ